MGYQTAFRNLVKNDAFTENSDKIDDKNILFSYLDLELNDDGEATSIEMRAEDDTVINRLIEISKLSYKSVEAAQVSAYKIIKCVAKVNNVDPKDSEAYKEIERKYHEEEAERIKMQEAFDAKIDELEEENKKALAKQEKLIGEIKAENESKLKDMKKEWQDKQNKLQQEFLEREKKADLEMKKKYEELKKKCCGRKSKTGIREAKRIGD